MAIDKLPEFAKDGQKNTDDLVLTDGFPVLKKPARQWFNWLFNTLTKKINEIADVVEDMSNDIFENDSPIDRTNQRHPNITYTNPSSNKYILVVFQCYLGGPQEYQAVFLINNSPMFHLRNDGSQKIITLLIPPQAEYRLTSPIADDVYISSWSEM